MNGTQMEIARGLLENNRALMQGHLLVLRDGFSQKLLSPVWGLQWPFMRGTLARPLPDSYWSYLFNFVFYAYKRRGASRSVPSKSRFGNQTSQIMWESQGLALEQKESLGKEP